MGLSVSSLECRCATPSCLNLSIVAVCPQGGADRPPRVRRRRPVDRLRLARDDLRRARHRARIIAPQPCIRWIHEDLNHDAAMRIAAKLRGGGPILRGGVEARGEFGSPPPRIVIGSQRFPGRQMPKPFPSTLFRPDATRRRRAPLQWSQSATTRPAACAPVPRPASCARRRGRLRSSRGTTAPKRCPSGT